MLKVKNVMVTKLFVRRLVCELCGSDEHLERPDGERGTECKETQTQHQPTLRDRGREGGAFRT